MGYFGGKKDPAAYNGTMVPGAVPVATPVPDYQQQPTQQYYDYQQKMTAPVKQQQQFQSQSRATQPTPLMNHSDPALSREPLMMKLCPNCSQESRTRVTSYPTWQTWCAAAGLIFVFWPIAWLPLVLDNCKHTDHHCVLCSAKVGKVEAFQDCCVTQHA